ncbi:hypothetical protein A6302_03063 [Methylobrevis pamukkalensis]|uniref:DUF4159 domain-containing protein n=2 Tax=Methylobrevis pamukkalensis TaxID=1439726 RepID=A0A1E3H005_9HYPH|nr:hypothetical protein A6302_03063 [Methylobrevis pamukkalensis]
MTVLDGFGHSRSPGPDVRAIPLSGAGDLRPNAENPAGLYGTEDGFRAVNTLRPGDEPVRLDTSGYAGARRTALVGDVGTDLAPSLFILAFLALVADAVAVMALTGGLAFASRLGGRFGGSGAAVLLAGLMLLSPATEARAQDTSADAMVMAAVTQTRLAYVATGDSQTDEDSRAGLSALSQFLASRTALEPGEPVGLDPSRDELSVYPLIYWPIDPAAATPARATMDRIDAFMRSGGTVIFDTRDQLAALPGRSGASGSASAQKLREMLAGLDIPPLEQVPPDHVMTKAFYLLNEFPGRYIGSPLWVEATPGADEVTGEERPVRGGDGVSSIMITGNDLAGAWAADADGNFFYPVVPGDARQREMAFRAGVNIVMYVLTGNYKADQVHIPALLERLGQ